MPDIFDYHDYRRFLKDFYKDRKQREKKFSHRFLSQKLGYGSSGAFADILSGRKNLTSSTALRMARSLGITRQEEEYFLHLVAFNQASTLEEKNFQYAKILSLSRVNVEFIAPEKYEYFSKWYFAAIRELLYFYKFKDDFKALGKKLNPAISAEEARKGVELLERLGLISCDEQGYYRQTSKLLSTPEIGSSLHIDNFQAATLNLALEALDRHPRELRDLSTVTLTLSASSLEQVKAALKALRQCVMSLAEKDEKVDQVYQLNIQLFPLTHR